MKPTIFLLFSVLVFTLHARVITVDNNYPFAGDYKTLQEAHDAASAGDIIYICPSSLAYAGANITKRLSIYGAGFGEIGDVPGTTLTTKISGNIDFLSGSKGSHVEGLENGRIYLRDEGICVQKCELMYLDLDEDVNSLPNGCCIIQSRIKNLYNGSTSIIFGLQILNSIIENSPGLHSNVENFVIKNNVIDINYSFSNQSFTIPAGSIFQNNIIFCDISNATKATATNNITREDGGFPTDSNNLMNVDLSSVFVDHSNDNYHLTSNSPAIGFGTNGTDCGIYGGDAPFVDGGYPALPSILQLVVPSVASQRSGLQVQFNVKGNR